jgi:[ribosomal protein S18]-alanine N-acetyltransferase
MLLPESMLAQLQRFFTAKTPLEGQLYPPLKLPVRFRPYEPKDFESCLQIYCKNAIRRFPDGHEKTFEAFLINEKKTFIIAELDSKVIGYGGLTLTSADTSVLCYGIVDPEFQNRRIGATLVLLRIAQLPPHPRRIFTIILAVDASMPIYNRFGFVERAKWKTEDGKLHPMGLLCIPQPVHQKIKSTLDKRGIQIKGPLTLYKSDTNICEVEENATTGTRLHFRPLTDDKAAPS